VARPENAASRRVMEKLGMSFVGTGTFYEQTLVQYAITKDAWGKGFATEAAQVFLQYAFEKLKTEKIVAVAEPENASSRRVMEKLGMKFVRLGEFYDRELVQYAISRESWLENQESNQNFTTCELPALDC